ncbi:amidase [uncultured Brevibacillus sp.]|uniref:amidase n=1 Tax=uncultured Brevibacillus sp. TaxID=169970 RepID=UPI00259A4585|nr:amidase [uncultured Brevibacillus sp.]
MSDLFFLDISTLSKLIQTKKISPVELTKQVLQRIEQYNPTVNAYIKVLVEDACQQAEVLERELMEQGVRGPLHGVPIAIKDILETKGHETTAGSKVFENWIPDRDATVVRKLKEAGAILIGKANLHEFAMGATTENPHYGVCRNPWDLERVPGGSSGGSAVAVATGLCYGAIGTDTAGSIRLPAAICGITGMKPTYGRVSRNGCLPFSWSLDHIGPMTRTVKDSAILLKAIAGFDPLDSATASQADDVMWDQALPDLKGIRLAVVRAHFFVDLDPEVEWLVEKAMRDMQALGAEIVEIELPGLDEALQALKMIAQSEVLTFHEPILNKYKDWYGEDLKYRFSFGQSISAVQYLNAQRTRSKFSQELREKLKGFDGLLAPANAKRPFLIGTVPPDQAIDNMFTLGRTPFGNITGLPALTLPCGFMSGNLPVGMQIIGRPFEERRIFQIAEVYERSQNWVAKLAENQAYLVR